MDIAQTFRRLGQQHKDWAKSYNNLKHQLPLIEKLYSNNGLTIVNTCGACPEQYDILKNGEQVAYYRLRHGEFRVSYPDVGGEIIFESEPIGDGDFETAERIIQLTKALRCLQHKLKDTNQ